MFVSPLPRSLSLSLTHWLPVFSCLAFSFSSGIFSAHDLRDLLIFVWFVETFAESYVINLNLFQTRQRLCILCGTDGVSSSLMVRAKTDDFPRRSQIVRWYVARISGAVPTKNAMYFGLAAKAGAPLWKVIPTNPKLYIGLFTETREKISSGNCAKKSSIIYSTVSMLRARNEGIFGESLETRDLWCLTENIFPLGLSVISFN